MKFLSTSKLLPPAFKFLLLSLFINLLSFSTYPQNWFSMPSFWEVRGPGMSYTYNIEAFDLNKDGKLDVVVGYWNDTYVYYGGHGILDQVVDVIYTGRLLAICDYNGDGFDDMITIHFTDFDSTREDYNGELLFYWGSDSTELAIDTIPDYSIPLPTLYPTFERFTVGYFTVGIQKGDLNGDGKIDVVLNSTHLLDSTGSISNYGIIYVYLGKEIPTDTADFKIVGHKPSSKYGHFFDVGNINGDAFDDLLISSNQPRIGGGTSYDSINYLHIFYGSEDFSPSHGNESKLYSSRVNPPDKTAFWFLRQFSVDDINGDGIDDLVIGRTFYDYPQKTTVHYGSASGIDTIPSFTFIQDTTNFDFFSSGGVTQNVGDFNDDGYDDFIIPAGWSLFALHFGGPYVSNNNRYGARGYSNAGGVIPQKSINMGDQTNDGVKDIAIKAGNYVLMLYGQRIATNVEENVYTIRDFGLLQNYPNPFNGSTVISYRHSAFGNVKLMIYDTLGREVTALVNEEKPAGEYKIEFDALKYNLASGVYFCELVAGDFVSVKKMMLLK